MYALPSCNGYLMSHFVRRYLNDFFISRVAIAIASGIVIKEPNFVWRIISSARSLTARLRSYADNAAHPFLVQCFDIFPPILLPRKFRHPERLLVLVIGWDHKIPPRGLIGQ